MKRLVYLLLFLSAGLNAQVLRTYPAYQPPVVTEEGGGETTLTNGLLVSYDMDDSGSTIADGLGSNDATSVSTSQNGTYKILGYSQEFNDAGDYIYVSAVNTTPGNDKLTISLWVRMTTMPATKGSASVLAMCILSDYPWWAFVLYIGTDNKPAMYVRNTTNDAYFVTTTGALSVNTLYHIVAKCRGNGQTLQLYVNGDDVSSSAGTFSGSGFYGSRTNLAIGNGGTPGTEVVIGIIDEFLLYNRSASVDSLYNGGSGVTYPFN